MLVTIEVSNKLAALAAKRELTAEQAAQQIFNLGYADWKSHGRKPMNSKYTELQERFLELKLRKLELQEMALKDAPRRREEQEKRRLDVERRRKEREDKKDAIVAIKLEQAKTRAAKKSFRDSVCAGGIVRCPDGRKVTLIRPNPYGKGWEGHAEGDPEGSVMVLSREHMSPV